VWPRGRCAKARIRQTATTSCSVTDLGARLLCTRCVGAPSLASVSARAVFAAHSGLCGRCVWLAACRTHLVSAQQCYGVFEIPAGDWLCEACAAGVRPSDAVCVVCPVKGGAMKVRATPSSLLCPTPTPATPVCQRVCFGGGLSCTLAAVSLPRCVVAPRAWAIPRAPFLWWIAVLWWVAVLWWRLAVGGVLWWWAAVRAALFGGGRNVCAPPPPRGLSASSARRQRCTYQRAPTRPRGSTLRACPGFLSCAS
jgi:hypothetical protein